MGFLSRITGKAPASVVSVTPSDLTRIGHTAFGGESPHPPGPSTVGIAELDGYAIGALESGGYPSAGTAEWASLNRRLLEELTTAAELGGDWGYVGALCVAMNFVLDADHGDPQFLAVLDRALLVLRDDGVAFTSLPNLALRRWEETHGKDDIFPAAWPRALEDVDVPSVGSEPPTEDLREGESRRLAQPHAGDGANVIFARRRPDGTIAAIIDGIHQSDGIHKQWEWERLSALDYPSFLRELGDRLVTPSFWAHKDLAPYFPCRARSRQEMRCEAKSATA